MRRVALLIPCLALCLAPAFAAQSRRAPTSSQLKAELKKVTAERDALQAKQAALQAKVDAQSTAASQLADAQGSRYHPGRKVQAVDTTAAGDTFLGALTVALAEGQSLDLAVREGIRASALCVTQAGAQPSIPTRAAVAQSPLPPDWSPL